MSAGIGSGGILFPLPAAPTSARAAGQAFPLPLAERAATSALSPTLSERETASQHHQAAQQVAQLERARKAGACSLLDRMTALRRYRQTELALLRRPHPQAPLSAQEVPLAEEIEDLYAKEVALLASMAELGLASEGEALGRSIEATRFRRDLALLRAEKERGFALQGELCRLLRELLRHMEEQARWRAMSPNR